MTEFKWDDSLEIGVKEMDHQHKTLIGYINDLVQVLEGEDKNSILTRFDTLAGYVVKHFKEEEELMESNSYEGLESHKIIHQNLLERVGAFRKQIEVGELDNKGLISFLKVWLTSHIKGIDMKYGQAFKENKTA